MTVAHQDVLIVYRLAAAGERCMTKPKFTIFNNHIGIRPIALFGIGIRPLSSFQGNSIIIHGQVTALDQHIVAHIQVYSIRARCFDRFVRSRDPYIQNFNVVALVIMAGPKTRILKTDILDLYIVAPGDYVQGENDQSQSNER